MTKSFSFRSVGRTLLRRWLPLGGAFALALSGCESFDDVARFVDEGRMIAKVGVLGNVELVRERTSPSLSHALRHFALEKVDAVVILGNLTHDGYMGQYREFAALWHRVMPPGVRLVAVRGFRENEVWEDRFASEFVPGAELMPPGGGVIDVGGFRFYAAYERQYGLEGMLSLCSQERLSLNDELGRIPAAALAVNVGSMSEIDIPQLYADTPETVASAQGLLIRAYDDEVVMERLDFLRTAPTKGSRRASRGRARAKKNAVYVESLGEPLRLERGADGGWRPNWGGNEAPKFPADARAYMTRAVDGAITVHFPPVLECNAGRRAFAYDVRCGKVAKYVLPKDFNAAEERAKNEVTAIFRAEELGIGDAFPATVAPISSAGIRGPALSVEAPQ